MLPRWCNDRLDIIISDIPAYKIEIFSADIIDIALSVSFLIYT